MIFQNFPMPSVLRSTLKNNQLWQKNEEKPFSTYLKNTHFYSMALPKNPKPVLFRVLPYPSLVHKPQLHYVRFSQFY